MTRFIIEVSFGNQIRIALVTYRAAYKGDRREEFTIHPKEKSEHFMAFGKGTHTFLSNRPGLRQDGYNHRPQYWLFAGTMAGEHHELVVEAIDDWVKKNLD